MPNTFELIQAYTVGSGGQSSIDFNTIPSTYTDLCFKISVRITRSGYVGDILNISYNGSSTNESSRRLEGAGSGTPTSASNSLLLAYQGSTTDATANTFGNGELYIPNYAGSGFKSASNDGVSENNSTTAYAGFTANLWSNTAAINQVTFTPDGGSNFVQYSTIYCYGVKNA
jgi:hypothetical protein